MQSDILLVNHKTDYNPSLRLRKKNKRLSSIKLNQVNDLESLRDNKYKFKKNPFNLSLLIGLIMLISIYSFNYYSFYFITKSFNYSIKKINHNGYVVRKGMIYLSILLLIEILAISLYLILNSLINSI